MKREEGAARRTRGASEEGAGRRRVSIASGCGGCGVAEISGAVWDRALVYGPARTKHLRCSWHWQRVFPCGRDNW